jgi:hypothetical protein
MLQVRDIVDRDAHQLPAVRAGIVQKDNLVGPLREFV